MTTEPNTELANALRFLLQYEEPVAPKPETWAEIEGDDEAVIRCGERWKAVAARIGCTLHGFNDDRSASFYTPDGNVIEIGPKFRAVIESLTNKEPTK